MGGETDRARVHPQMSTIAMQLDTVAGCVREYVGLPKAHDSLAMAELAQEAQFAKLPRNHPVMDAQLQVMQYLNSSQDHLTALAAALRTPGTVMALLTILRTQLVGAALAHYMADPRIDVRERVRRWMNIHLASLTESMRFVADDNVPEWAELAKQRTQLVAGAKRAGWKHAATPAGKWPQDWWIGDKPLGEGRLLELAIDRTDRDKIGQSLYRYLCATSHVQPHGFLTFVDRATARSLGDGSALVEVRMTGALMAALAMAAVGVLTSAIDNCCQLFGWPGDMWSSEVIPILRHFRRLVGTSTVQRQLAELSR